MTLTQLRKAVKPCLVETNAGVVEIIAPEGKHFSCGIHALVSDPAMKAEPKETRAEFLDDVYGDYTEQLPLEDCEDYC